MFQSGNKTSYDAYPPVDYMNEYNKTGMLHLKYKTMNQIEVPQMNFAKRQDKLNLNIVNNIDLNNVIRMNNITPLEKISGNLIYQEIKDEDFEDPNLPKLLKTFQYALEYLNAKQTKLDQVNKKLNIEYNQLINQSFEIEEKLKINKKQITKNKAKKKEHEMLLLTYESLVNFNCNPAQNTNIIMNNIKSNYDENISEYDRGRIYSMGGGIGNARFYCHICNGKYFNSEIGLENHMKKRHLTQIRQNSQREKEEMKVEEIQDMYDKKLEETRNHFQNLLMQQNEMITKSNLQEEIYNKNREKDEQLKLLIENNKNNNERIGNMFKEFKNNQDEFNQKILDLAKVAQENNKNQEIPKITIENPNANDFNKLINSIDNLKETLKNNEKKNNDLNTEILNNINNKLNNLNFQPYPQPPKNNYNINNNINTNINKEINVNPQNLNDNNKNSNVLNNTNMNNNITNIQPQKTLLDIKEENKSINEELDLAPKTNKNNNINTDENKNINTDENKNINNNNILPSKIENKEEKKEEKKDENNINNNKNNIISKNDFQSNNFLNYKESQVMNPNVKESNIDIQREKQSEKDNNNEKEVSISQLNNILESKMEMNPEKNDGDDTDLKNMQNQIANNNLLNEQAGNDLKIVKESYPIDQNGENHSLSKTDPKAFKKVEQKERDFSNKKEEEINFQPLKTFNKNKFNNKLFNFAKEFIGRDQPILNKKDLKLNDLNDFTKEIVEEEKYKNNLQDSENMEIFLENKVKENKIENLNELDKKSEGELLNVIKSTLNKINKINEKGQVAGFYFETMNKAIDLKMIENDEKMFREAYNKKGELKRTRTNTSKAKIAIEEAHKDIGESDGI